MQPVTKPSFQLLTIDINATQSLSLEFVKTPTVDRDQHSSYLYKAIVHSYEFNVETDRN